MIIFSKTISFESIKKACQDFWFCRKHQVAFNPENGGQCYSCPNMNRVTLLPSAPYSTPINVPNTPYYPSYPGFLGAPTWTTGTNSGTIPPGTIVSSLEPSKVNISSGLIGTIFGTQFLEHI